MRYLHKNAPKSFFKNKTYSLVLILIYELLIIILKGCKRIYIKL